MSDTREQYSATFQPLFRQRTLGVWQRHQVAVAVACIAVFLIRAVFLHSPLASVWTVLLAAVLAVDLPVVHGLSLWQLTGLHLGLTLRTSTGASHTTVSPISTNGTVGLVDVPGGEGDAIETHRIVNTGWSHGACLIWDSVAGQATAPIRVLGSGSQWASNDEKDSRADAFGSLLESLADTPEVVRIGIQSRALLHDTTPSGGDGDGLAGRDISDLEHGALERTMLHDYILTVTIDAFHSHHGRASMEQAGGMLADDVAKVCGLLAQAGGTDATWLTAEQLRGAMKTLNDPDASRLLGADGSLADDVPVQTSWREYADHVTVGGATARSWWIDRWPDTRPVYTDWIGNITCSPVAQLICTQVFHRRTLRQAQDSIDSQANESGLMAWFSRTVGKRDDAANIYEAAALERHRTEIPQHNGDIEFQGFLTVISTSPEQLDDDSKHVMASAARAGLHLDPQHDQQMARWVGALPLGLEGRR